MEECNENKQQFEEWVKTRPRSYTTVSVRKSTADKLKQIMASQPRGVSLSDYLDNLIS